MKIKGMVTGIYEKNGFYLTFLKCGDETIRVVGLAGEKGQSAEISGEFEDSPKYGKQFIIEKPKRAYSKENMLAFFSSSFIPGAGEETAQKLCEFFGDNTYDVVLNNPEKITDITGFGERKAEVLHTSLVSYEKYLPLICIAPSITRLQADKLMTKYGDSAANVLKKDPYRVMGELDNTGFLNADKLAKKSGWNELNEKRVKAAIIDTLSKEYNETGDCYLSMQVLMDKIMNRLNPVPVIKGHERATKNACTDWTAKREKFIKTYRPKESEIQTLDEWEKKSVELTTMVKKALVPMMDEFSNEYRIVNDGGDIYLKELYQAECFCARFLAEESQKTPIRYIDKEVVDCKIDQFERKKSIILAKNQKKTVYMALMNRISVATGGPGCGKTTIQQAMCQAWGNDETIILGAPTGRASKRMSFMSGLPAYTVSRLCGRKIENCFIIIDESGMLDILLVEKLLRNVKNCNIVFSGDANQLSSIGSGQFLFDLVDSQVIPKTVLDEGFRNSGSIAQNHKLISEGKLTHEYIYDDHFKFTKCTKDSLMRATIDTYKMHLRNYALEDIVLLLPTRVGNGLCVNKLNPILQDIVNKNGEKIPGTDFRIGDRVMQMKNNYSMCLTRNGEEMYGIFNGDTGSIRSAVNGKIQVLFDDGWSADYDMKTMHDFELAYAQTVHKAQGSEYKVVIYACGKEHFYNLNRSLFYTAETRAQDCFHMVGECWKAKSGRETNVFDISVLNTKDKIRNTKLSKRIREYQKENSPA